MPGLWVGWPENLFPVLALLLIVLCQVILEFAMRGGNGMQLELPKGYGRVIWRAIMEFAMLADGDRCLVGFSGGKDSAFLLYALAALRAKAPFEFELAAATIDPMFDDQFPEERLRLFCQQLRVPFYLERTNLAQLAFASKRQNPCARCAFFRRGALNRIAKREGYNRLALAHHHDDAVETFLLSLLYAGQIKTFTPVTKQDALDLLIIRPLIYLRESEIESQRFFTWASVPSMCLLDGRSARQTVKELLRANPLFYNNLAAAMRFPLSQIRLWPPELTREEMRPRYQQAILGKQKKF